MKKNLIRVLVTTVEDDLRAVEIYEGEQSLARAAADYYGVKADRMIQGLTSLIVRLQTEQLWEGKENGHHGTKAG